MDLTKIYHDSGDNPRNILQMVEREPEWAANQIQTGEEMRAMAAQYAMEVARLRRVLDAARCIRHWHDCSYNPKTGETEGMVVSAEHVRLLWDAIARYDAESV